MPQEQGPVSKSSLSALTLLSAALLAQGAGAAGSAGSNKVMGVRPLPAARFAIERGADLGQVNLIHSLFLDPTKPEALPSLPVAEFLSLAEKMLAQGPIVAIRREQEIAVMPKNLKAGAQAAIIPLAGKEGMKLITITRELAARLQDGLKSGDAGSAHEALRRYFDASSAGEEDASPADRFLTALEAVSQERKEVRSNEEALALIRRMQEEDREDGR